MEMEVKEIKFYNNTLLGVRDEKGIVWLAVRKTCRDIGLTDSQARRQVMNIQEDLVLSKGVTNLRLLTNGGKQELLVIKENFVTIWLAKIHLTPVMQKENPDTVEKLIRYQLEAQKVLHDYFLGTEEKAKKFYSDLGLKGIVENLETVLNTQKIQNVQINNIETMMEEQQEALEEQQEKLEKVLDRMTLDHKEQQKIHQAGKDRINFLLGGAHSKLYKEKARMYFINLWLDFCKGFQCATYKDLNPKYLKKAIKFIANWEYRSSKKKA